MPICSCVRNRDAPSSPRTTLLTAARAYVVLHLCIPARYVAAPKTGVWCGYIKSGCGSIRYAPALRLLANGSADRRWFATHTRHSTISSNSSTSTVNPSARCCCCYCCCYCCCCPAPACRIRSLRRGAGHLSVASLVLQQHPGHRDTQAGRNLEDSNAMDDRTTDGSYAAGSPKASSISRAFLRARLTPPRNVAAA